MCSVCLQSLVPARFETRTVTGLVKGHAYSVTAVEEVKLIDHKPNGPIQFKCNSLHCFHLSHSAKRRSTRRPKSVWCVSGTRGVKWSGTVPGVTSEEILTIFARH